MPENSLDRVVECFATATRYPKELLTPEADIENELGIDSVKFVEIVIALSEEFGLALQDEPRDPSIRTIGQLAAWIEGFLGSAAGDSQESAPAVTPPPATAVESPRVDAPAAQPQPYHYANGSPASSNGANGNANGSPNSNGALNGANGNGHGQAVQAFTSNRAASLDKPLEGKVALVTGSGRGVGRTIARTLAARGATVLVNSFHSRELGEQTVAEIQAAGGSAVPLWGSVANPDQIDEMFRIVEQRHGLDILVCNASDGRIGPFMDLTFDDWDRAFRTNVAGHHRCAMHASRIMRSRGGGSIVTLSAVGAHQYIDGLGAQGIAKSAVESLTRYLACELGGYGIRVNCVAGGPVYGDLLDKFPNARTTQDYWESMTPDGELCNPTDLAQTIAFLVSDEARGINGAVWMVDHGFSATADGQRRSRVSREAVLLH